MHARDRDRAAGAQEPGVRRSARRGESIAFGGAAGRGANMRKACCFTTALPSSSHRACCSSGERLSADIDAPFSLSPARRIQPGSIPAVLDKSLVTTARKKKWSRHHPEEI
jgi:hypothetical protein